MTPGPGGPAAAKFAKRGGKPRKNQSLSHGVRSSWHDVRVWPGSPATAAATAGAKPEQAARSPVTDSESLSRRSRSAGPRANSECLNMFAGAAARSAIDSGHATVTVTVTVVPGRRHRRFQLSGQCQGPASLSSRFTGNRSDAYKLNMLLVHLQT